MAALPSTTPRLPGGFVVVPRSRALPREGALGSGISEARYMSPESQLAQMQDARQPPWGVSTLETLGESPQRSAGSPCAGGVSPAGHGHSSWHASPASGDESMSKLLEDIQDKARFVTGEDAELAMEMKELNRKVWDEFSHSDAPDVFGNLAIANDGGFSEVTELWGPSRWWMALLMVFFIMSNIYFIIMVDMNILAGRPASGQVEDLHSANREMFLVTSTLASSVFGWRLRGAQVIAFLELSLLTLVIAEAVWATCVACSAKSQRVRWFCIERIFWDAIPQMASYSAMRLLHHVSPTVLTSTLSNFAMESQSWRGLEFIKKLAYLIVFHLLCFVVGFDSFLVKIRTAYSAINEEDMTIANLYGALLFMVQVLGVVRLGTFVQNRLFVFIFAGEDSIMQPREKAKQNVWNALLVRHIWRTYSTQSFGTARFVAVMLSFSDTDFQRLVLNERQHERKAVLGKDLHIRDKLGNFAGGVRDRFNSLRLNGSAASPRHAAATGSDENGVETTGGRGCCQ